MNKDTCIPDRVPPTDQRIYSNLGLVTSEFLGVTYRGLIDSKLHP